jgi:spore coat polysaccharide biosynthesis predicted glycosyltransferase SpsG
MKAGNLVIHADSGPNIGWGHLARSTAIAQAWLRLDGTPHIASEFAPDWLKQIWHQSGIRHIQFKYSGNANSISRTVAQIATSRKANAILLDGYRFSDEYESALAGKGILVCAIDDYGHAKHDSADLLINPNVYASSIEYPKATCPILKGSAYILLRDDVRLAGGQFRRPQALSKSTPTAKRWTLEKPNCR